MPELERPVTAFGDRVEDDHVDFATAGPHASMPVLRLALACAFLSLSSLTHPSFLGWYIGVAGTPSDNVNPYTPGVYRSSQENNIRGC